MNKLLTTCVKKAPTSSCVKAILCSISLILSQASFANCYETSLSENINSGEMLRTLEGDLFDTLAGDNITAMLWLPISSLLICGPTSFPYQGKTYFLYEITNLDDREKVTALKMGGSRGSSTSTGSCYQTQIMEPTPFNGNGGELIQMADGSIWQESSYQYLYLYEYYPTVTICPKRGQMILGDNVFSVVRVR